MFACFVSHNSYRDTNFNASIDDKNLLGVIIEAERGLAVTFRNKLNLLSELTLMVAGKKMVKGQVRLLHSAHNVALLKLDPASVDKKLLRACPPPPPRKA